MQPDPKHAQIQHDGDDLVIALAGPLTPSDRRFQWALFISCAVLILGSLVLEVVHSSSYSDIFITVVYGLVFIFVLELNLYSTTIRLGDATCEIVQSFPLFRRRHVLQLDHIQRFVIHTRSSIWKSKKENFIIHADEQLERQPPRQQVVWVHYDLDSVVAVCELLRERLAARAVPSRPS